MKRSEKDYMNDQWGNALPSYSERLMTDAEELARLRRFHALFGKDGKWHGTIMEDHMTPAELAILCCLFLICVWVTS